MPSTVKQQTKLFLEAIKSEPVKNLSQQAAKKFIKSAPAKKVGRPEKFMNLKKMLSGKI